MDTLQLATDQFDHGRYQQAYSIAAPAFNNEHNEERKAGFAKISGLAMAKMGRLEAAQLYFEWLLDVPNHRLQALSYLAINASALGRYDEAILHAKKMLASNKKNIFARKHIADCLRSLGQPELACEMYRDLIADGSIEEDIAQNYLYSLLGSSTTTEEEIFSKHVEYGQRINHVYPRLFDRYAPSGDKLKVAYLSNNFNTNIAGHFFRGIIDNHDRGKYKIVLISHTKNEDQYTDYFRGKADRWMDAINSTPVETAKWIYSEGINILVDLAGYSPGNFLPVLSSKPAPIQVTMLDSFYTTGLAQIDYFISDHWHSPKGIKQKFVEEIIRLPQARLLYSPVDWAPAVTDLPSKKNKHFTFGSFQRREKLTPPVISLWAKVLRALPNSRLVLKGLHFEQPAIAQQITEKFNCEHIQSSRLIFWGWSAHKEMLSQYGQIDVVLDPFPWNGGLTTCEALMMGVPVITLPGERLISRQGAALMRSLGLNEFVAESQQQYVDIAVRCATDKEALANLRSHLRSRLLESPLCDGKSFVQALENAYEQMWLKWLSATPVK